MKIITSEDEANSANTADPLVQLRRLLPHLDDDDLDLDAIDGEFYWLCCRRDLHAELKNLVEEISAIDPEATGPLSAQEHAHGEITLATFDALASRLASEHPYIGPYLFGIGAWRWIRLRDGRLMAYRTAAHDGLGAPPPGELEDRIELRVISSRWTGAEVEARIRSYLASPTSPLSDRSRQGWLASREDAVIRVHFKLVPAGSQPPEEYPFRSWPTLALAHIVVTVAPPLPSAGTLAQLYDAIVIGMHQWPTRLAGRARRQDKRVALRTWAVGVLVARGHKTASAISRVCAVLGDDEISAVQFTEDRRHLVERVPEAQPYVYAKPPRRPLFRDK